MNKIEYNDILAFHPGYYVKDAIEEMDLTQEEFAMRLDVSAKHISKLVNGEANISTELSEKLSTMLGTSIDLWLNLQLKYNEKVAEIERQKAFDRQQIYLNKIDYSFFVNLGLVEKTTNKTTKVKELLRFLKIANFEVFESESLLVQFRTTTPENTDTKDRVITNAWVQTVINIGQEIQTKPYNEVLLNATIPKIRDMALCEDIAFISELKELLAECGVALVVIPSLKKSKVYAAVKWINKEKVVLGITNRGQDADKFWFSLFHEIKHILQKQKNVIIDDNKNTTLENEANEYASEILIPHKEYDEFKMNCSNKYFSEEQINRFARNIGVQPGIVVGRLQNDQLIAHSTLNKLKCKYDFRNIC